MKKLIITLVFILISLFGYSQDTYQYCQVVSIHKLNNIEVYVQIGELVDYPSIVFTANKNLGEDKFIKDEKPNKPLMFISDIDALNYMAKDNWELVNTYQWGGAAGQYFNIYILKRLNRSGTGNISA